MQILYRHWIHLSPLACVRVAILLAIPGLIMQRGVVFAEGGQLYVGITAPVEYLDVLIEKTVDNTAENTLVPEPRRGKVFEDEDSADAWVYGVGLLVGYNLPLTENGFYLSGEVDIAFHRGTVEGQLAGVGTSPGRNQLGESWPDRWSFEKERSYGFTLKLGGNPEGLLRRWETNLYALGGIRLIETQFMNHFNGCMSAVACSPDEFTSGTERRDQDFLAWTVGIGMGKRLSDQLALRFESRYSGYDIERWITVFEDVGVSVPASVDAEEVSLLLSIVRVF